jgi:hypothetical protein
MPQRTAFDIEAERTAAWLESMDITPSVWDEPEPVPEPSPKKAEGKPKRKHQDGVGIFAGAYLESR